MEKSRRCRQRQIDLSTANPKRNVQHARTLYVFACDFWHSTQSLSWHTAAQANFFLLWDAKCAFQHFAYAYAFIILNHELIRSRSNVSMQSQNCIWFQCKRFNFYGHSHRFTFANVFASSCFETITKKEEKFFKDCMKRLLTLQLKRQLIFLYVSMSLVWAIIVYEHRSHFAYWYLMCIDTNNILYGNQ